MRDWILLLEDSEDDAELVRRTLRRVGRPCELVWTSTIGEARQALARAVEPCLMILDQRLDGKCGLDFLREIAFQPRWSRIPKLFLTTARDEWVEAEARALGAQAFMEKPVEYEEFLDRVGEKLSDLVCA